MSRQLGRPVSCLLHAEPPLAGADRPAAVAEGAPTGAEESDAERRFEPTADAPAPFSLREYARLLVLRSKVREQRRDVLRGAAPSAR